MEIIADALQDTVVDTLKLLPFLYITYVLMEYLERRSADKQVELLARVGRCAPAIGAAFGLIPQCGFSAAASSLYSGGLISIGTLLAVFLSTSDEMLPIFISQQVALPTILRVLLGKALIGMISGFAVDALLRKTRWKVKTAKRIHDLCEQDHCGCEEEEHGIFLAALIHTLQIALFIFLITLGVGIVVDLVGKDAIASFLGHVPVLGVFLAGLIGLIPNCAASVLITQLYLEGMLGAGQMMTGLLVSAGVGILVLFRTNRKHQGENIKITLMLYMIGIFWGLIIEGLGLTF